METTHTINEVVRQFDFLDKPMDKPKTFGLPSDTPLELSKMTPRKFMQDVGKVYHELGGITWLLAQAKADPAEFMKMLQKMLPKQMDLGGLEGMSITLIDQFGRQVQIKKEGTAEFEQSYIDLKEEITATGGESNPPASTHNQSGQLDSEDDNPSNEIATSGSPIIDIVETYEFN